MKKCNIPVYLIFFFTFLPFLLSAQEDTTAATNEKIESEIVPEFPGGMKALYDYLSRSIQYPPLAKEIGLEGNLDMQFVVETDGSISSVVPRSTEFNINKNFSEKSKKAAKKIKKQRKKAEKSLITETERVLSAMPKWIPGYQDGKAVRCYFSLPIRFSIQ